MTDRVAVDGFGLEDGSRHRGIGTYLRHLVAGLSCRDDVDLVVLAGKQVELPDGAARVSVPSRLPPRWQKAERERRLPGAVSRADVDLLHTTGQVLPRRSPVSWIHTLHDLTPLYFRDPLLDGERDYWLRVGPRLSAAAAVVCPSRASADQAIRYLDLAPDRLHVIPHGVDPAYTPDGLAATYDGPYLLWVSTWGPHKGLDEALAVINALAEAGYPHRLVIAGHVEGHVSVRIDEAVSRAGCEERVVRAGRVEDLAAVYRGATALLVTSRAEGFGLPALEAMACGTSVVSFDNTSLPEVIGDGGLLVADGDVAAMVTAVQTVLDDNAAAEDLRRAAIAHASRFTWAASIDAHVEVYRTAGR